MDPNPRRGRSSCCAKSRSTHQTFGEGGVSRRSGIGTKPGGQSAKTACNMVRKEDHRLFCSEREDEKLHQSWEARGRKVPQIIGCKRRIRNVRLLRHNRTKGPRHSESNGWSECVALGTNGWDVATTPDSTWKILLFGAASSKKQRDRSKHDSTRKEVINTRVAAPPGYNEGRRA